MIKIKQIERLEERLIETLTNAKSFCTNYAEPKIKEKGTAFNKNFGTSEDTVAKGNHTHNEYKIYSGTSIFNSSTGVLVKMGVNLSDGNYRVSITPTSNPEGSLGEIWIESKTKDSFIVKCSGSTTTTTFDWMVH